MVLPARSSSCLAFSACWMARMRTNCCPCILRWSDALRHWSFPCRRWWTHHWPACFANERVFWSRRWPRVTREHRRLWRRWWWWRARSSRSWSRCIFALKLRHGSPRNIRRKKKNSRFSSLWTELNWSASDTIRRWEFNKASRLKAWSRKERERSKVGPKTREAYLKFGNKKSWTASIPSASWSVLIKSGRKFQSNRIDCGEILQYERPTNPLITLITQPPSLPFPPSSFKKRNMNSESIADFFNFISNWSLIGRCRYIVEI